MAQERGDGREIILKLVNILDAVQNAELVLEGCAEGEYIVEQWQMSGFEPDAENSFEEPEKVTPAYTRRTERLLAEKPIVGAVSFGIAIPGNSVTVMKLCRICRGD